VTDHGPSPPLAPGEEDLDVLLVPRLSSNPYELVVPTTWYEEPVHAPDSA
jgi:hypothetical protein